MRSFFRAISGADRRPCRRSRRCRGSAKRASISSARPTASSQPARPAGFPVERDQRVGQAGIIVQKAVASPGRRASSAAAGRRRRGDCSSRKSARPRRPPRYRGSPSAAPARASASIISPFQLTSTLSSRPGRTRLPRAASSSAAVLGQLAFQLLRARDPSTARSRSMGRGEVQDVAALEIARLGHVVDACRTLGRPAARARLATSAGVQR